MTGPSHADASKIFKSFGFCENADAAYRQALRNQYCIDDDIALIVTISQRLAQALKFFARSRNYLDEFSVLGQLYILPSSKNLFVSTLIGGEDYIVVSHGFLDLLAFHARASACFRMAEVLEQRGVPSDVPSKDVRAKIYLTHLSIVGEWLKKPFALDELPASLATPELLREEFDVLMMGLLFLLAHEGGHFALGHHTEAPAASTIATFNLVTKESIDEAKIEELAADQWATNALNWSIDDAGWEITAVVRMFLLIGLGQAANGQISATHPYVSNRLSHLLGQLSACGVGVTPTAGEAPHRLAREYDAWRSIVTAPFDVADLLRTVGLFTARVAKAWVRAGGDSVLLRCDEGPPIAGQKR